MEKNCKAFFLYQFSLLQPLTFSFAFPVRLSISLACYLPLPVPLSLPFLPKSTIFIPSPSPLFSHYFFPSPFSSPFTVPFLSLSLLYVSLSSPRCSHSLICQCLCCITSQMLESWCQHLSEADLPSVRSNQLISLSLDRCSNDLIKNTLVPSHLLSLPRWI